MASSLAPLPPRSGHPATLESVTSFRVKTAALSRPAGFIQKPSADMVLLTSADGGVVVYPPSEKLIILASRRKPKAEAAVSTES
jgi:hypothetical protein